ncbi:uncharacterized protein VTP21DRAFT_3168 [Calcarisporiella thermophila]|uniref:uncharacterized protein n=1 Tax=Calcarisporiella thermophila TaxID=911321 RepID=UPI00374332C5
MLSSSLMASKEVMDFFSLQPALKHEPLLHTDRLVLHPSLFPSAESPPPTPSDPLAYPCSPFPAHSPQLSDLFSASPSPPPLPPSPVPSPRPTRPSKHRRRLSSHETALLMSVYDVTPKPSANLRQRLAKELGMTPRSVQIWFQNRRAKLKREELECERFERESGKKLFSTSPTASSLFYIPASTEAASMLPEASASWPSSFSSTAASPTDFKFELALDAPMVSGGFEGTFST